MIRKDKIVYIYWKDDNSSYAVANKKRLVELDIQRTIGASVSGTRSMLAKVDELRVFMPDVLGISPNHQDWNKKIKEYWDSITVDVPAGGTALDVGFVYDIKDMTKKDYIDDINRKLGDKQQLRDDEDLLAYIDDRIKEANEQFSNDIKASLKVLDLAERDKLVKRAYRNKWERVIDAESDRFRVGSPSNVSDYLLYRYCLIYGLVANEKEMVNNTNRIRFYLYSDEEAKLAAEVKVKGERSRMETYLKVIKDPKTVDSVLYAMRLQGGVPEDPMDKYSKLDEVSKSDTEKFVSIANNKNLETVANVERFIDKGILTRYPNTETVVDSTDTSILLGNSMNEVVAFMNNEEHKAITTRLTQQYKTLPKN